MKSDHVILGVHVTDRFKEATEVQKIFTEYGKHIKTRLGLHEIGSSPEGLVLLEIVGDNDVHQTISSKLNAIHGIEVKEMIFGH